MSMRSIQSKGDTTMNVLYPRCCGLDVHKKTVVACVRIAEGDKVSEEVRSFETMTKSIKQLGHWLRQNNVRHVAMEATGVFWKPIWNLLEDEFELMLVNAHHMRTVPGRKTDVNDSQWIAQLLAHGLLKASFVPNREMRQLRELLRFRATLSQDRSRVVNRLQKSLEDANIKLSAVATDILGRSGRDMLDRIIAGEEDPKVLAELARRRMRGKIPQLQEALEGHVTDHHRFILREMLDEIDRIDERIARIEKRAEEMMRDFSEAVARLETIPGVGHVTAQAMVAEIGVDMDQFPTAGHLASWAGVCPGNNESAGKRKSGRTRHGNKWLRRVLIQAAWAAARSKGCYFKEQYHRIAARRGAKRAIVSVAHSLLVVYWHMMNRGTSYQELGADYLTQLNSEYKTKRLVRQLEKLGHTVRLGSAA